MKNLKEAFNSFIFCVKDGGPENINNYEEQQRIRYVEQMNTLGIYGSFFFVILDFLLGLHWAGVVMIFMNLSIFLSLYLSKKNYSNLAPFISIMSCAISCLVIGYLIKGDIALEYIIFTLVPLPSIALSKNRKMYSLAFMTFLVLVGGVLVFTDINQVGIYEMKENIISLLKVSVFFQACLLMIFQVRVNNREIEGRYNQYLANHSKIENQTRLSDLGRLYAGIAHEINNPLAVIKGSGSYCLKRLKKGDIDIDRLNHELQRINKQVERVVKIIEGLKYVSRDATNDPFQSKSINEVVQNTYDLCSFKLNDFQITSNLNLLEDDARCYINPVQIEQVIFTLVSNAIDVLEGQDFKEITISLDQDEDHVFISVIDNGPGIPKDIQTDIFKPFFTTKELGKGTGLGLSIAFEIIQKHDGLIKVGDGEKGGAFVISLPKEKA